MGQAFDRDGNVLGEAYGDTKREVFDKLTTKFKDAHELRISKLEEPAATSDPFAVTLTLKGEAGAVVRALVHGLPLEALLEFGQALDAEMAKRATTKSTASEAVGSER